MRTVRLVCGAVALGSMLAAACAGRAQIRDHHFASTLGFEFDTSSKWSANLAGDFPLLTAQDLEPQVRQNPEFRASACNQKIFFAKLGQPASGQPASSLVVGVIPTDCMEQMPSFDAFKGRTKAVVATDYRATAMEEGAFQMGAQNFWVLRAKGTSPRDATPATLEYVATVFPRGLVYWRLEAYSEAAIADFEHLALRLTSGATNRLVPEPIAMAAVGQAGPAPAALPPVAANVHDALRPDLHAPHHFESGLGFSYDVPPQLAILDAKNFNAVLQFVNSQKPLTPEEARSAACSEGLLAAERDDEPETVVLMAHASACMGMALDPGNLPRIGYARLSEISRRYALTGVETEVTNLGEHPVWAMRAAIAPNDPDNPMRFLAVLLLPVPQGIVEFVLQARTRAHLDELMATQIAFADGAASQLFPASFLRRH